MDTSFNTKLVERPPLTRRELPIRAASRKVKNMSKFAPKNKSEPFAGREDATRNKEGGIAFKVDPLMELYLRSATCLVGEPKFYDKTGEGDKEIMNLIEKVSKIDGEFPLQLAAYCRNEMYLRSLPLLLLVDSCKYVESKKYVKDYAPAIIKRADELSETIACYKWRNGDIGDAQKKGMLCNPLKRGMGEAVHNFKEYHFAKYDRDGPVKLRDVFRIVHPKPTTEAESALYKKIVDRTLTPPETWEVVISTKGSTKENWESILPKMPFMARLRNLRNFLDKEVDITPVILETLTNPEAVRKSKQFPYRFLSAYKEIENHQSPQTGKLLSALSVAIELSVMNIPEMPGVTFVTCDNSGSMSQNVSEKSKMSLREVADLFGAMLNARFGNTITSVFGDTHAIVPLDKKNSIITNAQKMERTNVGCSTNAYLSIKWLLDNKKKVDRIVMFSDCQCYNAFDAERVRTYSTYGSYRDDLSLTYALKEYKKRVNPNVVFYSIDLAGYGTSQFPQDEPNVVLLAGWSDKVLNFIPAYEEKTTVIEKIRGVKPETYRRGRDSDE